MEGAILFRIKYTSLPHKAFFFHPLFLISGWLARIFGVDIGIVHWAIKIVGIVAFFIVFYKYLDYLKLPPLQSVVASVLVGISSGLGGLFEYMGLVTRWHIIPADLRMPEMSTFWAMLWNPLFPHSLALIVLIMFWLDRGTHEGRTRDFWASGCATGLLALLHPYILPLLFVYAAILISVRQSSQILKYLTRFLVTSLPLATYVGLLSIWQPLLSQHSESGRMRSPSPLAYLLGFGLPILICVAGMALKPAWVLKHYWHLVLWFVLSFGFAYLPLWFQRKLIMGAQIPLCILAGICTDLIVSKMVVPARKQRKTGIRKSKGQNKQIASRSRQAIPTGRNRPFALAAGAVVLTPLFVATPVYLIHTEAKEVLANVSGDYYIKNDLLAGMKFLRSNSKPDDVVFATYETSQLIPAIAGNTVVWGHWAMSVDVEDRNQWLARLFYEHSDWEDKSRSSDFWGTDIRYIFADGNLRESIHSNPERWRIILENADQVFANDSVIIYKRHDVQP